MLEDETTNAGCASVELNSVDEIAQLQLQITIELTAGGLIRARASVINLVEDPYAVNDCVIAFPVPQIAHEILDFAGLLGQGAGAATGAFDCRGSSSGGPQGPYGTMVVPASCSPVPHWRQPV
jgi:hypothetical protein